MEQIIIQPTDEGQQDALLTILKGLKIPYKQEPIGETERIIFNPDLMEKLKQGRIDMQEGKGIETYTKDLGNRNL